MFQIAQIQEIPNCFLLKIIEFQELQLSTIHQENSPSKPPCCPRRKTIEHRQPPQTPEEIRSSPEKIPAPQNLGMAKIPHRRVDRHLFNARPLPVTEINQSHCADLIDTSRDNVRDDSMWIRTRKCPACDLFPVRTEFSELPDAVQSRGKQNAVLVIADDFMPD